MSVSGPCVLTADNNCVQSSSYGQANGYGAKESCRIDHPRADPIRVIAWDVEASVSCSYDSMI
eukprot:3768586-Prymnesium_polylepis.1